MSRLMPYVLVVLALGLLTAFAVGLKIDDGTTHLDAYDPVDLHPSPVEGANDSYAYVATTQAPTTSTTVPKHDLTRKQRTALYEAATGAVNGYPCGGDLPSCRVLRCESGGNPMAANPTSTASGLWQILDGTWGGFRGYARAMHAPTEIQNEKARQLFAGGRGAFHWRSCL